MNEETLMKIKDVLTEVNLAKYEVQAASRIRFRDSDVKLSPFELQVYVHNHYNSLDEHSSDPYIQRKAVEVKNTIRKFLSMFTPEEAAEYTNKEVREANAYKIKLADTINDRDWEWLTLYPTDELGDIHAIYTRFVDVAHSLFSATDNWQSRRGAMWSMPMPTSAVPHWMKSILTTPEMTEDCKYATNIINFIINMRAMHIDMEEPECDKTHFTFKVSKLNASTDDVTYENFLDVVDCEVVEVYVDKCQVETHLGMKHVKYAELGKLQFVLDAEL